MLLLSDFRVLRWGDAIEGTTDSQARKTGTGDTSPPAPRNADNSSGSSTCRLQRVAPQ